jgi:hypothetical protein
MRPVGARRSRLEAQVRIAPGGGCGSAWTWSSPSRSLRRDAAPSVGRARPWGGGGPPTKGVTTCDRRSATPLEACFRRIVRRESGCGTAAVRAPGPRPTVRGRENPLIPTRDPREDPERRSRHVGGAACANRKGLSGIMRADGQATSDAPGGDERGSRPGRLHVTGPYPN